MIVRRRVCFRKELGKWCANQMASLVLLRFSSVPPFRFAFTIIKLSHGVLRKVDSSRENRKDLSSFADPPRSVDRIGASHFKRFCNDSDITVYPLFKGHEGLSQQSGMGDARHALSSYANSLSTVGQGGEHRTPPLLRHAQCRS